MTLKTRSLPVQGHVLTVVRSEVHVTNRIKFSLGAEPDIAKGTVGFKHQV